MANPTVLELANRTMDEMIHARVVSVVGNPDADARGMLQHINRQGRDLAKKGPVGGWTILQRLHTFSTIASQEEYDLPADFGKLVINTVWDRTLITPMAGPLSAVAWQSIKSGLIGSGVYSKRWRIVRSTSTISRKFVIDPVPTGVENLAFEYVSNGWVALADLSAVDTKVNNDSDLVLLDEDLMVMGAKWRWRSAHGMDIVAALAEYNEMLDSMSGTDEPAEKLNMAGPTYRDQDDQPSSPWNPNVPETGYGS